MIGRLALLAVLAGCTFDEAGLGFADGGAGDAATVGADAVPLDAAELADAPVPVPDAAPDACVDIVCENHDDCPEAQCCFQAMCAVGVINGGCNPEVWWEPCS